MVVVFVAEFAPALPPDIDHHGQKLGVDRFTVGGEEDEEFAAVIVGQVAFGEALFGQNINDARYGGRVFGGQFAQLILADAGIAVEVVDEHPLIDGEVGPGFDKAFLQGIPDALDGGVDLEKIRALVGGVGHCSEQCRAVDSMQSIHVSTSKLVKALTTLFHRAGSYPKIAGMRTLRGFVFLLLVAGCKSETVPTQSTVQQDSVVEVITASWSYHQFILKPSAANPSDHYLITNFPDSLKSQLLTNYKPRTVAYTGVISLTKGTVYRTGQADGIDPDYELPTIQLTTIRLK